MEILSDATFKGNLNVNGSARIDKMLQVGNGTMSAETYAKFCVPAMFHEAVEFGNTEFHHNSATFNKKVTFNGQATFNSPVDFSCLVSSIQTIRSSEFISDGCVQAIAYTLYQTDISRYDYWAKYGPESNTSNNYGVVYDTLQEFHYTTTTFGAKVELKNACLGNGANFIGLTSTNGSHFNQTFQNKSGIVALTSDIPNVSSIISVKYAEAPLTAPSDCTVFTVDLGVTDLSFVSDNRIINAKVERYFNASTPGYDSNLGECYWEPASMDVFLSNKCEPGKVLVRKASGVPCDNTARYMLKVFYI